MIHIEQNQIVPENPDLRVLSASGDYADNDLIECAHVNNPDFALSAFSATFIRYGGMVYQHSDPLKLGEALLAFDSESTHDAVTLFKEEEARRIKREGGDFTPENPVPADENVSQITQEEAWMEKEKVKNEDENLVNEETVKIPVEPESIPETEGGGGSSVQEIPIEPVVPVEVPTTPSQPEVQPAIESDLSTQNTVIETIPERPVEIPEPVEPPPPLEALIESVTNGLTE